MRDSLLAYSALPDNTLSTLDPLSDAIQRLQSELVVGSELGNAARTFSVYIQNLQGLPPESPLSEQLSLLFTFRTFLPIIPSKFLGMGTRDVWVLVVVAYFNALQITTALKFPALAISVFAIKRTEHIVRIENEIHSMLTTAADPGKVWEIEKGLAMMRVPMLYVVDYRFRHCVLTQ